MGQDDVSWAFDILEDVSRTFAVPINMLDDPYSTRVGIGYLICRISDTVEDSPKLSIDQKNSLFKQYRYTLRERDAEDFVSLARDLKPEDPAEEESHWELVVNADRVIRVFDDFDSDVSDIIEENAIEMTHGMQHFTNKYDGNLRLQTIDELEEYCYYVAGTVGNMLADLEAEINDFPEDERSTLRENAQGYGLLLQLVNIIKDVHDDYHSENNIYIPSKILSEHEVDQEDILLEENLEEVQDVMEDLIEHAENQTEQAREYLRGINRMSDRDLGSWIIPYLLAVATLRELNDNSKDALMEGGVKIDRSEVYAVINTVQSEVNIDELDGLEEKIRQKPLHEY